VGWHRRSTTMKRTPVHERPAAVRRALAAITRPNRRRGARRATWTLGDPVVPALRGWPVAPPDRPR
jgi:hypothetical protein